MQLERQFKSWTEEEIEYLCDKWGIMDAKNIAKRLCRTENAILAYACRLRLGKRQIAGGRYLSLIEAEEVLKLDYKTIKRSALKKELKATKIRVNKNSYWRVTIEDIWQFVKDNEGRIDSTKIEKGVLGAEPEWMQDRRKKDAAIPRKRNKKWTEEEDRILKMYYKRNYNVEEIAKCMNRSISSIYHRANRVIGAIRKIDIHWTDEEVELMLELEGKGLTDKEIAYELGRDFTHIADKRRRMRLNGEYEGNKKLA